MSKEFGRSMPGTAATRPALEGILKGLLSSMIALIVTCMPAAAVAQGTLEVIPLRHRTADQVIPVLRPLLAPGGALSGQANQLIVRTTPQNLAELRTALDAIDRPSRRLMISVRFDREAESSSQGARISGTVRSGDVTISNEARPAAQSRVEVRAQGTRSSMGESVDQRVQVLEGGRAFIATGQSRPIRERGAVATPYGSSSYSTTVIQDAMTGFEVVPRLAGSTVQLDIAPQRDQFASQRGGVVNLQRADTTVSARLGEWVEIGGVVESATRSSGGIGSTSAGSSSDRRRIWVMVEEVRP